MITDVEASHHAQLGRTLLIVAGGLNALAAALHLAVIPGGPDWYRFLGAGEGMARMAERGMLYPTLVTLFITGVLATWALFAWSGAGMILRLPLLRTVLVAITMVYAIRGVAPLLWFAMRPEAATPFWLSSSAIVLVYGAVHAAGVALRWPALAPAG